jgi:hypothetical protein
VIGIRAGLHARVVRLLGQTRVGRRSANARAIAVAVLVLTTSAFAVGGPPLVVAASIEQSIVRLVGEPLPLGYGRLALVTASLEQTPIEPVIDRAPQMPVHDGVDDPGVQSSPTPASVPSTGPARDMTPVAAATDSANINASETVPLTATALPQLTTSASGRSGHDAANGDESGGWGSLGSGAAQAGINTGAAMSHAGSALGRAFKKGGLAIARSF